MNFFQGTKVKLLDYIICINIVQIKYKNDAKYSRLAVFFFMSTLNQFIGDSPDRWLRCRN